MLRRLVMTGAALVLTTPMAMAGPISSACSKSERGAPRSATCSCVQQVADMTLSSGDQRRASKFFKDPHQAQVVRMSKSTSDNAFWARYKQFASSAERYCR